MANLIAAISDCKSFQVGCYIYFYAPVDKISTDKCVVQSLCNSRASSTFIHCI